jgi:hypothetical protein
MKPLFLSFLILFMAGNSSAAISPGSQQSSMEIIANNLKKYIFVLTEPAFIYHYFNADDAGPEWSDPVSAVGPKGYAYITRSSQTYWENFGYNDGQNSYGRGLYFAEDPVATNVYGGFNFVLLQLQLPVGFRVLDLSYTFDQFSPEMRLALQQIGCENINNLTDMLTPQNMPKSPVCLRNVMQVLRDQLQIDGISYSYNRSFFSECATPGPSPGSKTQIENSAAFILTDIKSIRPGMVRIFNRRSRDDREDRIHIQSLFYKNAHDSTLDAKNTDINLQLRYLMMNIGKLYPGYKFSLVSSSCGSGQCTIKLEICEIEKSDHCLTVSPSGLSPQPYPAMFDSYNPPLSYSTGAAGQPWMWADLNHQPTDPAPGEWIKKNLLGCGKTRFVPAFPQAEPQVK